MGCVYRGRRLAGREEAQVCAFPVRFHSTARTNVNIHSRGHTHEPILHFRAPSNVDYTRRSTMHHDDGVKGGYVCNMCVSWSAEGCFPPNFPALCDLSGVCERFSQLVVGHSMHNRDLDAVAQITGNASLVWYPSNTRRRQWQEC